MSKKNIDKKKKQNRNNRKKPSNLMDFFFKLFLGIIAAIIFGMVIFTSTMSTSFPFGANAEIIGFEEFKELAKEKHIGVVYYKDKENYMVVALLPNNKKSDTMTPQELEEYQYLEDDYKRVVNVGLDKLGDLAFHYEFNFINIDYKNRQTEIMKQFADTFGQTFILIFVLIAMMKVTEKMNGKGGASVVENSDVTFDDIIGQDEVLDDVKFITELINNPDETQDGICVPKGILLSGPPGTGKTLIAKAIAGEAGVPFIYLNASSLIELYVGMGARRVREAFQLAKKNAPCIMFIDEIDAVGGSRNALGRGSEDTRTVNALLQEMDGFSDRKDIFVIAATNNSESLDTALVRAGRFDREIVVMPPKDWQVRAKLFRLYLNNVGTNVDVDIEALSKETSGFTGADIRAVCNEAGLIALNKKKEIIDTECVEEAIDKKIFKGNRADKKNNAHDREIIAYHEAGHAVMTYICGLPIARASIVASTSGVGGAVFQADRDTVFNTDKDLINQVMIAYAGRASEEIKFHQVTTGASNDITQATNILMKYVSTYGFDKNIGLLDMHILREKSVIDGERMLDLLSSWSRDIYSQTFDNLKESYDKVDLVAKELLAHESLNGDQIEEILKNA